jgi:hypothetical protein
MVSRQEITKQASIPSVGLLTSDQICLPSAQASTQSGENDVKAYFDNYFLGKINKF